MEKEETFEQIQNMFEELFINIENHELPNNDITRAYQKELRGKYDEYNKKYQQKLKYDNAEFQIELACFYDDFKGIIAKLNEERCKGNIVKYDRESEKIVKDKSMEEFIKGAQAGQTAQPEIEK